MQSAAGRHVPTMAQPPGGRRRCSVQEAYACVSARATKREAAQRLLLVRAPRCVLAGRAWDARRRLKMPWRGAALTPAPRRGAGGAAARACARAELPRGGRFWQSTARGTRQLQLLELFGLRGGGRAAATAVRLRRRAGRGGQCGAVASVGGGRARRWERGYQIAAAAGRVTAALAACCAARAAAGAAADAARSCVLRQPGAAPSAGAAAPWRLAREARHAARRVGEGWTIRGRGGETGRDATGDVRRRGCFRYGLGRSVAALDGDDNAAAGRNLSMRWWTSCAACRGGDASHTMHHPRMLMTSKSRR